MKDYLSLALAQLHTGQWYGWKTHDDNGNKIPNDQRMCYECIKIIKDGATMPSKAEVEAKIQELKDAEQDAINKKASAKSKLLALGLTEEEIKLTFGI